MSPLCAGGEEALRDKEKKREGRGGKERRWEGKRGDGVMDTPSGLPISSYMIIH